MPPSARSLPNRLAWVGRAGRKEDVRPGFCAGLPKQIGRRRRRFRQPICVGSALKQTSAYARRLVPLTPGAGLPGRWQPPQYWCQHGSLPHGPKIQPPIFQSALRQAGDLVSWQTSQSPSRGQKKGAPKIARTHPFRHAINDLSGHYKLTAYSSPSIILTMAEKSIPPCPLTLSI